MAEPISPAPCLDDLRLKLDMALARSYGALECILKKHQILKGKFYFLQRLSECEKTLTKPASKSLPPEGQVYDPDHGGVLAQLEDFNPVLFCEGPGSFYQDLHDSECGLPETSERLLQDDSFGFSDGFLQENSLDSVCHDALDGLQPRTPDVRGYEAFTLPTGGCADLGSDVPTISESQQATGPAAGSHAGSHAYGPTTNTIRIFLNRMCSSIARWATTLLLASVFSQCPTVSARPTAEMDIPVIERTIETTMSALPYGLVFASTLWAMRVFSYPCLGAKNLRLVRMLALVAGICWIVFQELVKGEDHIKPISLAVWYLFFTWQSAEAISPLRHWRWNLALTGLIGIVLTVVVASMLPANVAAKGGPLEDLIRKATEIGPLAMLVWSWALAEMQQLIEGGCATHPEGNLETGRELDRLSTATSTSMASGAQELDGLHTGGRERANS